MPLDMSTVPGQEFITRLLERSPPSVAQTFTPEQLEAIQQAFSAGGYSPESSSNDEWQGAEVTEIEACVLAAMQPASPPLGDRRRPGRSEYVHPSLISLLRHPTVVTEADLDDDNIRPAQGLVITVLLSLVFWLLFGIGILPLFL